MEDIERRVNKLSPKDREIFNRHQEDNRIRESIRLYHNTVDVCFQSCIFTFRSKNLDDKESNCINNCAQKLFLSQNKIGSSFLEVQQAKT